MLCLMYPLWYWCYFCFNFFQLFLVENIAKTGAKMVIISNSSRRSSVTIEKVKGLGFDASLFLGAITSGELTHQYLQRLFFWSKNMFSLSLLYFWWNLVLVGWILTLINLVVIVVFVSHYGENRVLDQGRKPLFFSSSEV